MAKLVPELLVSNFARSLSFYAELIGFNVLYARPEDAFAYLDFEGAQIMIEQVSTGVERSWIAAGLCYPFGRGINLQIDAPNVEQLYARCLEGDAKIFLPLEEKWYRRDRLLLGVRQFIVMDPDGYLLRFSKHLGTRPIVGDDHE